MGDTVKWMRALRNQKKEHLVELNQVKLEYEALLLQERGRNDWLHNKLIETQRKVRTLTYEIARKEAEADDLRKYLRGTPEFRRSTQAKTSGTESVASNPGE